jgi:hypothetical protein
MTDLLTKFSEAAKAATSSKTNLWECVKRAFADHLNDINTDSLPEEIKIFYDSVKLRVKSAEVFGYIDNNEASFTANDIIYMADVISSGLKKP